MNNMSLFAAPEFPDESETIEYKESWHDDYLKSLAAFSNTRGGILKIGVHDKKKTITGWVGTSQDQEVISNKIVNILGIHPVRVEIEQYDTGNILAVSMEKSAAPVSVRRRYYRRIGNTTREVPESELPRFLLERTGQSWDILPFGDNLELISEETIQMFCDLAHKERIPELSPADKLTDVLRKLNLQFSDGTLSRGALMLFGKKPQNFFISANIQIGRFKDETTIIDERVINGNLFDSLDKCMQVLRNYIFIKYEIPAYSQGGSSIENLQRREIWEFPFEAVREAILNALIHRDYTRNGSIQIRVYDDKLIVMSPGGLMEGLTVLDLLREPHDSLRRNPKLADIFYFARLIERWGTGTLRMQKSCRVQGFPDPVFESTETLFSVILLKNLNNLNLSDDKIENMVNEFIKSHSKITRNDLSLLLNGNEKLATNTLLRMKRRGTISQQGSKRGTFYILP